MPFRQDLLEASTLLNQ